MARPREYNDRSQISLRLPRDLHAQLTDAAAERGLATNNLICRLLAESLPRLIPAGELLVTREKTEPRVALEES